MPTPTPEITDKYVVLEIAPDQVEYLEAVEYDLRAINANLEFIGASLIVLVCFFAVFVGLYIAHKVTGVVMRMISVKR